MTVTKIANLSDGAGGISPYQGILRNAIINGDMRIAQRGTSFAAIAHNAYSLDRYNYQKVGDMVHTITQEAVTSSEDPYSDGLQYALKVDCTTVDTSTDAGDICTINQRVEGYNVVPFIGRTAVLSFWVKATKTGTYCVAFRNYGSNRTYVREYTVSVSDTWEHKSVTVPFTETAGTWNFTNDIGLYVLWALKSGTTYQTSADSWETGNFVATSNQVNTCDSTDNNFWLTGVQLHPGSVALPFDPRPYSEELRLCQRYCVYVPAGGYYSGFEHSTDGAYVSIPIGVAMRTDSPSITLMTAANHNVYTSTAGAKATSSSSIINAIVVGMSITGRIQNLSGMSNGYACTVGLGSAALFTAEL